MSDISQKIKEMAQLSIMSGKITEMHEKNLKLYPFVVFEEVEDVKIDYDLGYTKPAEDKPMINTSYIHYYLKLDESKNDQLDKRFSSIEKFVRDLFWQDVSVEVYFNDQIKFKSKKI